MVTSNPVFFMFIFCSFFIISFPLGPRLQAVLMSLTTWGGTLPLCALQCWRWPRHQSSVDPPPAGVQWRVDGGCCRCATDGKRAEVVPSGGRFDLMRLMSYIVLHSLFRALWNHISRHTLLKCDLWHYVLTFLFLYVFLAPSCSPNSVPIRSDPGGNAKAILLNTVPQKSRGSLFGIYTIMDDLGKGLGPALVASWVRAMGRTDAFKCLGRKRCRCPEVVDPSFLGKCSPTNPYDIRTLRTV
jgi:hypothetical protein